MRIVLQCGLAKTGTTFLQKSIFSKFDLERDGVLYNPEGFSYSIILAMQRRLDYGPGGSKLEKDVADLIEKIKSQYNPEILFCSFEPFGGGSSAWEFPARMKVLKKIVPDAEIIVTLRYQADWLVSLYKQHIHHSANPFIGPKTMKVLSGRKLITLDEFLNYRKGHFEKNEPSLKYTNVDINYFDWSVWIDNLIEDFGKNKVKVFFYEDLRSSPEDFINRIKEAVTGNDLRGSREVVAVKWFNKGFSKRAIELTRKKIYLQSFLPFHINWNKIDSWLEKRSLVFLKKAIRKIIMFFSWGKIMRLFDRLFPSDGKLLSLDVRDQMDEIFKEMNRKLLDVAQKLGQEIVVPEIYYK